MTDYDIPRDFTLFDSYYSGGTSAPAIEPVYVPEQKPERRRTAKPAQPVKKKTKTNAVTADEKTATMQSFKTALKLMFFAAIIVSVISCAIYLNAKLDVTATRISAVEDKIDIANSEKIRLNSELEGLVAVNKVKDYAENKLGMVKLENYKINYFTDNTTNQVVLSGGKSYGGSSVGSKLKQLFDKIF